MVWFYVSLSPAITSSSCASRSERLTMTLIVSIPEGICSNEILFFSKPPNLSKNQFHCSSYPFKIYNSKFFSRNTCNVYLLKNQLITIIVPNVGHGILINWNTRLFLLGKLHPHVKL